MGIVLADRSVGDAKRTGRLEPEPLVIPGVPEQQHEWPLLVLSPAEEFRHQRTANTLTLVGGCDAERSYGDHRAALEITSGTEGMPNNLADVHGHQLKANDAGGPRPGAPDDSDFLRTVAVGIAEGGLHQGEDRGSVAARRGPDRTAHVRQGSTLTSRSASGFRLRCGDGRPVRMAGAKRHCRPSCRGWVASMVEAGRPAGRARRVRLPGPAATYGAIGAEGQGDSMSDAIDRYELVAAGFDRRVKAVPADKWDAQSPCEGWVARDVVTHVVRNHRSMAAAATETEAEEVGADEDPGRSWSEAYERMRTLSKDPDTLSKPVSGPGGPIPLEEALGSLVSMDTHIHTWDLARAVGGDERLDPDVVRLAWEMLQPMDAMIRQPGIFGPKLDPPSDADEQTKLLYFLGRRA